VDDIADGTIKALKPLGYEIVNLGSDKPAKLMDVIRSIERILGAKARFKYEQMHPADVPATWASIGKARRLLGWEPKTSLEKGLEGIVGWYRENQAWAKDVRTDG
jgi:nucleoside-diphosphate-sugar epimerase